MEKEEQQNKTTFTGRDWIVMVISGMIALFSILMSILTDNYSGLLFCLVMLAAFIFMVNKLLKSKK